MTLPPCTLPAGAPAAFVGGRVSVKEAFGGATLLLTGVTGYVGSVVLEHLLRVQPDVQRVFVIIRSKRGLAGMLGLIAGLCHSVLARLHVPASCSRILSASLSPQQVTALISTCVHVASCQVCAYKRVVDDRVSPTQCRSIEQMPKRMHPLFGDAFASSSCIMQRPCG